MKTDLYCIKCQKMVRAEMDFAGRWFHENTVRVNNSPDPGDRYDLVPCYMEDGTATRPPPPFDLDQYVLEHGQPPEIVGVQIYTV
jgi:hypothetical protein